MEIAKRDGRREPFDDDKVRRYVATIAGSHQPVGVILDRLKAMAPKKTADVLSAIERVAADMIVDGPEGPLMDRVASRAVMSAVRKEAFGSFARRESLWEIVARNVRRGVYDGVIVERYCEREMAEVEEEILRDERDGDLSYCGWRMFVDKYLIRDGAKVVETPQIANVVIAMFLFIDYDPERRLAYVKRAYDYLSTFKISLPTPVYSGLRTTLHSYSSCCVLDAGPSVDSILAVNYMVAKSVTERYGIGVNCGRIDDRIIPVLKMVEAAVRGFSQGVRGGSATVSFPFWHRDIATIISLKNNRGTVDNRVRGIDYSVGVNRLFLSRAIGGHSISLFAPSDVPRLTDNYKLSDDDFASAYSAYEGDPAIEKKTVDAMGLLAEICRQRYETGRIYIYFIDNSNTYSPFDEPIFSSNLCQEIFLPTASTTILPMAGLSGVCVLACVNVGRLADTSAFSDLEDIADVLVRAMNNIIDMQHYAFPQLERMAKDYRPLGIGISDLFHLLAIKGLKYDTVEGRDYVHKLMEKWQYSLLSASCDLARECGRCAMFGRCRYRHGAYPHYKKTVDDLVTVGLSLDWADLSARIAEHGLRNTCLSAIPPTASSSAVSNSTPGVDPPRHGLITKLSKAGAVRTLVPDYDIYREKYTLAAEVDTTAYLKLVAVIQKFVDQGISANTYYMASSPSVGDILKEITTAFSYGLKSLYYLNSSKGVDTPVCSGEACAI